MLEVSVAYQKKEIWIASESKMNHIKTNQSCAYLGDEVRSEPFFVGVTDQSWSRPGCYHRLDCFLVLTRRNRPFSELQW